MQKVCEQKIKEEEKNKNEIFKITQNFLKSPPLVVWGSGATISFGLPSMEELNNVLRKKIETFNKDNNNLEIELGKDENKNKISEIRKIIWTAVNEKNKVVIEKIISNDVKKFDGIKLLIEKFINTHPKVLNIVTTNYDTVLENFISFLNVSFSDGFSGKNFSKFDQSNFKNKNQINIVKVHGSLNWFKINNEDVRCLNFFSNNPQIIVPGKNKYQECFCEGIYRDLIQKSDELIDNAKSLLIVGFGFNDEHLTPKLKTKIQNDVPVVLITKKLTDNCLEELRKANKYILFEELESNKTKIIYKPKKADIEKEIHLIGNYWELNKFMEIL